MSGLSLSPNLFNEQVCLLGKPQGYVPISNQKIWLTLYFDKKKQVPTKWLNWRHLLSTNKSLEISLEPSMTYCKQLTSLSFVDT